MWISKKKFKAMEKRAKDLSINLSKEREEVRTLRFDLERETSRANDYEKLSGTQAVIIKTWKTRLQEREDVFIGKTIKKLIESTGKTHIVNRYVTAGAERGLRGGLFGNRGLF